VSYFVNGMPICIVRQTVAQSLSNATWTAITFDTEDVDRDNMHSTSVNTSRLTAQTAGYYLAHGVAAYATNGTGGRAAGLSINGTRSPGRAVDLQTVATAATTSAAPVSSIVFLNVGDYLELQANQASTGSLNTSVLADVQSSLAVLWVSSA